MSPRDGGLGRVGCRARSPALVRRGRALCAALGAASVVVAAGSAPSRAAGDAIVLEAPQIEIDLQGRDPAGLRIMIGDALGADFVSFEGGRAIVEVPFPDSPDAFTVSFLDAASGEAVFEQRYRMTPYQPFDRVEVDAYGQLDPYGTFFANTEPDLPSDKFDAFRGDYDAVFGTSLEVGIDRWSFAARGEGVQTTREYKQFRDLGEHTDLSDMLGSLDYKGEDLQVHMEFGDAYLEGNAPLVNEGFANRGYAGSLSLFDERIKITGGYTFGTDSAGAEHLTALDGSNYRFTGAIDVALWRDDYVDLTTRGSYYDIERPEDVGFLGGGNFVGERAEIWSSGATLGLFEDRVVFSTDFAWSNYANPTDFNLGVTDFTTFDVIEVDAFEGDAQRYRLDALLWDGDDLQLDVFGEYSRASPFYRSIETYVPPDRRTYLAGIGGSYGPVSAGFEREVFFTNIESFPGAQSTREITERGHVALDLEDYRDGFGEADENAEACLLCQAIPSAVSFEHEHWRIKGTNGEELIATPGLFFGLGSIVNESTDTYRLVFDWDFDSLSTSLELFHAYDNDHTIGNGDNDKRENSAGVGAHYRADVWSLSANGFAAVVDHRDISDKAVDFEVSGDADFSLSLEDLPDLAARGDIAWYRTKADDEFDDRRALNYSAQASLDFSKFLTDVAPWLDSYLTTTFLYEFETNKSAFFGTQHNIDMSWTVSFGAEF